MNTDKAEIRVYPCPSVVEQNQAPPSLTHYAAPCFWIAPALIQRQTMKSRARRRCNSFSREVIRPRRVWTVQPNLTRALAASARFLIPGLNPRRRHGSIC